MSRSKHPFELTGGGVVHVFAATADIGSSRRLSARARERERERERERGRETERERERERKK